MYTGTVPTSWADVAADLLDLQQQITTNLNSTNASIAGLQTQIKQVTLTLEGELRTLEAAFGALEAYVNSRVPS